jgi:alkanesulfonate monooxygenase SsuD/methylene tetrahydromethanopterin reductase-like flavin-dependent oxidoreductase (luciferase family)
MRFGIDVPISGEYANPRLLGDMAYEAEQAGWDGFFLQDGLAGQLPMADPWIALAAVALRTERVHVGVFLTPLPRRQPWEVARQATTMDHLSGGRLIFGGALGHSEIDFTPFGQEWDARVRAERLDEALDIVTGLWRGQPFSYAGRHFTLDQAVLTPSPLQRPRVPVWLAAGWPRRRPLRRAARWDGVYLMTNNQHTNEWLSVADLAAAVRFARAERAGIGATEPFEIAANGVAESQRDAQVAAYAEAGATWWVELDVYGSAAAYRSRIRVGPPEIH